MQRNKILESMPYHKKIIRTSIISYLAEIITMGILYFFIEKINHDILFVQLLLLLLGAIVCADTIFFFITIGISYTDGDFIFPLTIFSAFISNKTKLIEEEMNYHLGKIKSTFPEYHLLPYTYTLLESLEVNEIRANFDGRILKANRKLYKQIDNLELAIYNEMGDVARDILRLSKKAETREDRKIVIHVINEWENVVVKKLDGLSNPNKIKTENKKNELIKTINKKLMI